MKKIMLSMALLMCVCLFANAQDSKEQANAVIAMESEIVTSDDGYKVVKIEELNAKVQEALKTFSETYTVKDVAYNVDKKLTKVTLVSKENLKETKTVVLNEDGKEVKV